MTPARPLPVVLAGGRSSRFGRDKLRESWRGGLLIDAPLAALRHFFGDPVAIVGDCHADVAIRADIRIADITPGAGPIGGVVAALSHPLGRNGIFVLAGDLADITAAEVERIWGFAEANPDAWAVLAETEQVEPCIGVYRYSSLSILAERLNDGRRSLHDAIPGGHVVRVLIDAARARNVNEPGDLAG